VSDEPANDHHLEITLIEKVGGRQCGDCQLCCKLLPVRSLDKPAGRRCQHQRHGLGCMVYARLNAVSRECHEWNCRWLVDPDTAGLPRPDRCHYVIDMMPDYVFIAEANRSMPVVQIWVDPAFRNAHREPKLRAWLDRLAREHGVMAVVRWDSRAGLVLIPPSMNVTGEWAEKATAGTADQGSTWPGRRPTGL
jgi:hypothetical protein